MVMVYNTYQFAAGPCKVNNYPIFVCLTKKLCCRFKNRPHMTFDDASASPDQEFELHRDTNGTIEYSTK